MTIAYIRTYSNKQQTESQKNAIEQFAKAKKIEIDKWLKDAKNSSKEKNRLEDVIKNLQEGDILIVADVTRLSRKLMEIMHLILLCIEKKVALYCIKEGYSFEDNVNSKTLAFTFGLVSQIYLKIISIMFNKIVEFLFCADIIKTPKVFCLTFGVHYMTYFLLSNKSYPIYYLFISASIASNSGPMFRL